MKITKRKLKRIIKEEMTRTLREQFGGGGGDLGPRGTPQRYFPDLDKSHEYEGPSGTSFDKYTLAEMQQAIDYFREERESEEDAADLEKILAMAIQEKASGAEEGSDALADLISGLDTVVYEEMPHEIYRWVMGK
jgi:hypothetical protein